MEIKVLVLGSTFSVAFDEDLDANLRSTISGHWRHLDPGSSVAVRERFHLALAGRKGSEHPGITRILARDVAHAPDLLASTLTVAGIRQLAGRAFMFHAAGLATEDGQVVALIGPSGRGKTTAARALGRTMGYVSDETVAFTPDLNIVPYPKPLSIGRRPGVKHLSRPDTLGMRVAEGPLRLAALILLDRREEPTSPRYESVDLAEALGELANQSSSLASLPSPLRSLADVIAATGGVRRFVYSDADDLPALVTSLFQASPSSSPETISFDKEAVAPTLTGHLSRGPFIDAMMIDDSLAILTERRIHVLDGIGPYLWQHANDTSIDELIPQLQEAFGPPPTGIDLSQAVLDAVDSLVSAGLLIRKDA